MDAAQNDIVKLGEIVKSVSIPPKLQEEVLTRLDQLGKLTQSPTFLPEYDRIRKYIDWIVTLPWNARTQDNLDLVNAKGVLTKTTLV